MSYADDRFYVVADSGSLFYDDSCPDGFETAARAAVWAREQGSWPELTDFLADGMSATVALGRDLNLNDAWTAAWAARDGDLDELADAPPVRNHYRKGAVT
jgi:hypothetical protein